MSEFYDVTYPERRYRRRIPILAFVLVAIFAAVLGGLASAYLGPAYLYGRLLPYPPGTSYNPSYSLPPISGDDALPELLAAGAVAQVAQRVGPAVVGVINRARVSNYFQTYEQDSTGTGIIFDKSGLIVTNQHVIDNAYEIYVTFSDSVQVKAQLVGADERTDLAVLRINLNDLPIEHRDLPIAEFGDSSQLVVGELAVAIGNPLGIEFQRTVTSGIISALERTLTLDELTFTVIQTDAAINSGNSGGALVNARGQVIGINQAKIGATGVEGMGFAIPINAAKPIIEEIVRVGKVIRPWLGIRGAALTPRIASQIGISVTQGIYIEVVNNSPAQRAGLRTGDIITKYNGVALLTYDQLLDLIAASGVNGTATLEVTRGKSNLSIAVKLEAAP